MRDEWKSGPPPHVGWWNASAFCAESLWRWWDGRRWSCCADPDTDTGENAANYAKRKTCIYDIKWRHYYPANARVPRIVPTQANTTRKAVKP